VTGEVRHLLSNFACGSSGGGGSGSIRKITPVVAVSESVAVLAERQTQVCFTWSLPCSVCLCVF
jgi:hypothetical protein